MTNGNETPQCITMEHIRMYEPAHAQGDVHVNVPVPRTLLMTVVFIDRH
jgi:hypothetical protein